MCASNKSHQHNNISLIIIESSEGILKQNRLKKSLHEKQMQHANTQIIFTLIKN
jgi:hypothetical protein